MKRICLLLLAIAFIMTMTGCRLVNVIIDTAKDQSIMNQREEKNQQLCESIYNDLQSKNSSELSELFCEKIKNSHDLSAEISQALNCIDGNIVSYESIDLGSKGLSLHYIFDTPTNLLCFSTILGVKTDKNNAYKIKVSHCIRFEYDSDYEGVFEIKILKDSEDENNPLCSIGEFLETIVPKQIPDDYVNSDDGEKDSFGYTKTTSENILTALKNHDAEGFNNLFSQEARLENVNLSREINDILDFVDGNLVSYSKFHGGSGEKTSEYGEYTEFEDFVEIYDIMSDSGEMYEIEYNAYYVNKAEPSKQGIGILIIKHVNSANTEIFQGGHEVIDEIRIVP